VSSTCTSPVSAPSASYEGNAGRDASLATHAPHSLRTQQERILHPKTHPARLSSDQRPAVLAAPTAADDTALAISGRQARAEPMRRHPARGVKVRFRRISFPVELWCRCIGTCAIACGIGTWRSCSPSGVSRWISTQAPIVAQRPLVPGHEPAERTPRRDIPILHLPQLRVSR
jgi:hypothetical protein